MSPSCDASDVSSACGRARISRKRALRWLICSVRTTLLFKPSPEDSCIEIYPVSVALNGRQCPWIARGLALKSPLDSNHLRSRLVSACLITAFARRFEKHHLFFYQGQRHLFPYPHKDFDFVLILRRICDFCAQR